MEHKVASKTAVDRTPIIRVECSCGYYQQKTVMNFFESLWLKDTQHMLWFEQQPA